MYKHYMEELNWFYVYKMMQTNVYGNIMTMQSNEYNGNMIISCLLDMNEK